MPTVPPQWHAAERSLQLHVFTAVPMTPALLSGTCLSYPGVLFVYFRFLVFDEHYSHVSSGSRIYPTSAHLASHADIYR